MQESNKPLTIDPGVYDDEAQIRAYFYSSEPQYLGPSRVDRFEEELEQALYLIERFPTSYGFREEPVRRVLLRKSFCALVFIALEEQTVALALIHESMDSIDYFERICERLEPYTTEPDDGG